MKDRHRRDSSSTDANSIDLKSKRSKNMAKAPLISEDNMLNADSSSDVASGGESDGPEEGMDRVFYYYNLNFKMILRVN
jgi:hypothetical protein